MAAGTASPRSRAQAPQFKHQAIQPQKQLPPHQIQKQGLLGGEVDVHARRIGDAGDGDGVKVGIGERLRGGPNQMRAPQVFVLRAAGALLLMVFLATPRIKWKKSCGEFHVTNFM